jgi:hypothetical protein
MKSTSRMYVVTLRRDVQQKAVVRVEASSRQEAIDVAESAAADDDAWKREDFIGSHEPTVELASKVDAALARKRKARAVNGE